MNTTAGGLHHVEIQVVDAAAKTAVEWLLERLGYSVADEWDTGCSWALGATYIVLEQARRDTTHDRRGSGVNHLAFRAGAPHEVDALWREAVERGWQQLYTDRHPHAGGRGHYAAYLENADRFKVELVASPS